MSTQTVKKYFDGTQLGVIMSKRSPTFFVVAILLLFTALLGACSTEEIPPTPAQSVTEATPVASPEFTATPVPPTATLEPTPTVEPTVTAEPTMEPTATSVPPTATTPPTATPLPPLDASGGGVIAYVSDIAGVPGIQIMNADGSDQRRLTDAYQFGPSWSPDGQQIVFADNADPWSISTVDALSGEITGVTDLDSMFDAPGAPDWSPDGNSFAMIYEYDLYTMKASGGAVKKLIHFPGDVGTFSPDWSPDGQQLVFVLDFDINDSNFDIYRSDADGSNVVQLTSHEADDHEPAWSPDGTKIAFGSRRDGNWELFTMNADGSNIQNISNSPDHEQRPAWSPDGSRIAFQSNRDGNWEIYVMNADGTDVQRLTDNDVKDIQPEWRP